MYIEFGDPRARQARRIPRTSRLRGTSEIPFRIAIPEMEYLKLPQDRV